MTEPLDITALGMPVRFEPVGAHAEDVRAALASAWSRCIGLPLTAWGAEAEPLLVRVELLEEEQPERTVSMHAALLATGERRVPPGGSHLARGRLDSLLIAVTHEVTVRAIDANRGRLLMFHAAALADEAGRGFVLVARSGTGKTTLTAALGHRWHYLSDETAAICDDGTLVPYPKPLSMARPALDLKLETPADELGLLGVVPARLAGLVLLDRRDSGPARLVDVPAAQALVALAGESSALVDLPRPLARLAGLWADLPLTGRLEYAEAADAVRLLHSGAITA